MYSTPNLKKPEAFLPKIQPTDLKKSTNQTLIQQKKNEISNLKKQINEITSTPQQHQPSQQQQQSYNIVVQKPINNIIKQNNQLKRNSLDDQFHNNNLQKRNRSVLVTPMTPTLSHSNFRNKDSIHASPFIQSQRNIVSTLLQQKQKEAQQNQKKDTLFISKTTQNFFKKGNHLQVPSTPQSQEQQQGQQQQQYFQKSHYTKNQDDKSKKPELTLEVFHRNSVVYDESPAKMKQIRDEKKQQKQQQQQSIYFNNNKNEQQQQELYLFKNRDQILESIIEIQHENLNSSEKSPNINQLLSPLTPTPKLLEQFYDPKKTAFCQFNFKDRNLLGEEALSDNAVLKYNKNYKEVQKIVDVNSHYNNEGTIEIAMLQQTMNQNILPRKLGIVKDLTHTFNFPKPNAKQKLDLSNQNISQRYHQMISSAMKHQEMNELYSINLASNNLTGDSLKAIAINLPPKIQKINLESNNLGANCSIGVSPLLNTAMFPCLRILNLENNNISDLGFLQLLEGLNKNRSVYSLNLSHNKLTDGSGGALRSLLKESSYIQELYLHWNKISSQGGLAIAQGLESNSVISVLDLSHNGLGALQKLRCGLAIIESCSIKTTSVRHLDLSFNMFQQEEAQDISKYLQENNRTLFGLHFEGNHGSAIVDSRGFLKFNSQKFTNDSTHIGMIEKRRIKGGKCLGSNKLQNYTCSSVDCCWICDGWQEVKFEIKVGCSDSFLGNPVFLHLDFENYRPHYMDVDQLDNETYVLTRMCPPNRKINFFFSDPTQPILYYSKHYPYTKFKFNDELDITFYNDETGINKEVMKQQKLQQSQEQQLSQEQQQQQYRKMKEQKTRGLNHFQFLTREASTANTAKKYFKLQYLDSTVIEYLQPTFVNCIETSMDKQLFYKHDYIPNFHTIPRQPETYFIITKTDKWTFAISLFRTYVRDSEELFDQCFEADWQASRLDKLSTQYGDINETKSIFRKNYNMIKNLYKYYSSLCLIIDIPSITQNQYSNLLLKSKITDGKLLKISDVDINFITTNSDLSKEKTHRNPDKALVRYEFLESIGRLAIDKYIRNNVVSTFQDAINLIFSDQDVVNKFLEVENPQQWRDLRYWNEECDMVLKKYLGFIKILWETVADSKKTEKRFFLNYKTMNIFEFQEMVKYYDLLDDNLTERDVLLSFNLSMMTQVDELNSDRFIQMSFVEFLESLARLAEKKQLIPLGDNPEEYTLEERKDLALHYKLESMLDQMQEKYENIQIQKKGAQDKSKQSQNFIIKKPVKITPLVPDPNNNTIKTSNANIKINDSEGKISQESQEQLPKSGMQLKIQPSPRTQRIVMQSKKQNENKNGSLNKLKKQRSRTLPQRDMQIKDFLISSLDRIDDDNY